MALSKKKAKTTIAALVLSSEEAMIGTLNRYVELSLELAEGKAAHEAQVAALNADFDKHAQPVREEMAMLEASIQLFCTNHRAELFPPEKIKSRDYTNATLGFAMDPPSVAKRISSDTFEAIALRLSEMEWGRDYMGWTPTLDKEALLRDRANLAESELSVAGIRFKQEERFFIKPKSDSAQRKAALVSEIEKEAA